MPHQTRKSSPQRREQIARAVLQIIGQQGATAFTTTALAREVGVTSGALFRHFATRDDILREAVRYATARIDETFPDPSMPPTTRIVTLAKNRLRAFGSEPGILWLLRSEQAHLMLPSDAAERLHTRIKRSRQFVLDAIRQGAEQRTIRKDIEPRILLVLVMGTIHALLGLPGGHGPRPHPPQEDPDHVLSALMHVVAPAQSGEQPLPPRPGRN